MCRSATPRARSPLCAAARSAPCRSAPGRPGCAGTCRLPWRRPWRAIPASVSGSAAVSTRSCSARCAAATTTSWSPSCRRPQDRRGLEVRPLTSDELGVCCRAGHPLAGRRRTAVRDLLAYPWVLLPRYPTQRRLAGLFAAQDLAPPLNVVETNRTLPAQPAAAIRCAHLRGVQDRRDRGGVGTGDARRAQDHGAARSGHRQAARVAGCRRRPSA